MEIIKERNTIVWKAMFKKITVPITADSQFIYDTTKKCVYVAIPGEDSMFIRCFSNRGEELDSRSYSYYFKEFFIDRGYVRLYFYSYAESSWCKGTLYGSAGITGIENID